MKKALLTAAIFTMVMGTAACSSKNDTTATTTAAETTTSAAETTTAAETEETEEGEDVEEVSMTGTVTAVNDNILTVKSDDDDSEKDYDLSKAEVSQEFPFAEGDIVEIMYPFETEQDPVPVISLEVLESVLAANTDPSATGTVQEASDTSLTLELEDGESYTIAIANAYIVADNGITTGKEATVTFIGDLDDEPMATKVVMADSYSNSDAERNAFIGKVAQIDEDSIVLESASGEYFTFVSEDLDFSAKKVGDTVRIFYTGTVTGKSITAEEIE